MTENYREEGDHHRQPQRRRPLCHQGQDDLRQFVGFSAADEIEKLDRLKSAGSISEQEYTRLRTRLVQ